MAPLPANNTKRYFLDYSVGGVEHTLLMRVATGTDDSLASGAFEDLLTELSAQLYSLTVLGMRVSAEGSDISLPATYSGATSFGSGAADKVGTAGYVTFLGRTADGRRTRISIFGNKTVQVGGDFRASGTEVGDFVDAIAWLQGNPSYFRSISGLGTTWYPYADTGYNSYWRNKLR